MGTLKDAVKVAFDELSPLLPLSLSLLIVSSTFRFVWNCIRGDYGYNFESSASDVEDSVDMPFSDFEPEEDISEEKPEEIEEDLSLKWTCDYCGRIHKNTDCVCDACGGRRLRW